MTTSSKHQPLLSLVVTTRNDSDQALQRMQIFVDGLLTQARQYQLFCELVVVEWNPPSDRPSIVDAIFWTAASEFCNVRIITVPPGIHAKFDNSDEIPLFQMIAKNTGIRRARGKFILATNVDILFSNELMGFFASGTLRADRMYRIDRCDVPDEVLGQLATAERLQWCRSNVFKIHRYRESVDVKLGVVPPPPTASTPWRRFKDWFYNRQNPLHTNACGDFTLLAAETWNKVHGYPELPLRAMKLDGLLCYVAHYSGSREFVLKDPMQIYHLDHPARSDGAILALSKRGEDRRNLQLPIAQYRAWVTQMQETRQPILFNDSGWGMVNVTLPETLVGEKRHIK